MFVLKMNIQREALSSFLKLILVAATVLVIFKWVESSHYFNHEISNNSSKDLYSDYSGVILPEIGRPELNHFSHIYSNSSFSTEDIRRTGRVEEISYYKKSSIVAGIVSVLLTCLVFSEIFTLSKPVYRRARERSSILRAGGLQVGEKSMSFNKVLREIVSSKPVPKYTGPAIYLDSNQLDRLFEESGFNPELFLDDRKVGSAVYEKRSLK